MYRYIQFECLDTCSTRTQDKHEFVQLVLVEYMLQLAYFIGSRLRRVEYELGEISHIRVQREPSHLLKNRTLSEPHLY